MHGFRVIESAGSYVRRAMILQYHPPAKLGSQPDHRSRIEAGARCRVTRVDGLVIGILPE